VVARAFAAVVLLSGCNQVFGLTATELIDAADTIDAPRLFVPPDGGTSCPPAPDFEAWIYAPKTLVGSSSEVVHPSFLADDRVVFTSERKELYESMVDGGARLVDELELALIDISWPSAAPGADLIWFIRVSEMAGVPQPDVGFYYAHRNSTGWTAHRADLGISGYQVQVGAVGFYAGTARMVVGVTPTMNDRMRLVELSSSDGIAWTSLDSFPFSTGDVADFDPSLSADGCLAFYTRSGAVQLAVRGGDGRFGAPTALVAAAGGAAFVTQGALDPSRTRLWLKRGTTLVEGRPP